LICCLCFTVLVAEYTLSYSFFLHILLNPEKVNWAGWIFVAATACHSTPHAQDCQWGQ
jgi:hypothetical protein